MLHITHYTRAINLIKMNEHFIIFYISGENDIETFYLAHYMALASDFAVFFFSSTIIYSALNSLTDWSEHLLISLKIPYNVPPCIRLFLFALGVFLKINKICYIVQWNNIGEARRDIISLFLFIEYFNWVRKHFRL